MQSLLAGLVTAQMALSLYLPSMPLIQSQWHLSKTEIQLTLSVYFASFGLMQIFYGILSDHFGRRPLLMTGLILSAVGGFFSAHANHLAPLLVSRIIQGTGTAALPVIIRASTKDMFQGHKLTKMVTLLSMTSSISLALAPFLGSWLSVQFGWRYDFYFTAVLTLLVCLLSWRCFVETNKEATYGSETLCVRTIATHYKSYFKNKPYLYHVALILLGYFLLMLFLVNAPFFFQQNFGASLSRTSYYMLSLPVSYLVGLFFFRYLITRVSKNILLFMGAFIVACSASMFIGPIILHEPSVFSLMTAFFLGGLGSAFIFVSGSAGMLHTSDKPGVAASLSGVVQLIGTSALTSLIAFLHWNTIEGLGWISLATALIIMMLMHLKRKEQNKLAFCTRAVDVSQPVIKACS